jgi:hypothetical protein
MSAQCSLSTSLSGNMIVSAIVPAIFLRQSSDGGRSRLLQDFGKELQDSGSRRIASRQVGGLGRCEMAPKIVPQIAQIFAEQSICSHPRETFIGGAQKHRN